MSEEVWFTSHSVWSLRNHRNEAADPPKRGVSEVESTNSRLSSAGDSQVRRPFLGPAWSPDAVDRRLVELLLEDGRMSNAKLARRVGVPESTCSGRLRVLRERHVIAGVHADVDLGSLDVPLEAMIALRSRATRVTTSTASAPQSPMCPAS